MMQNLKGALRSKTILFAVLLAAFGAAYDSLPIIKAFVTPQVFGVATFIVGIVIAILRVLTTQSLADKAPPKE